MRRIAPSLRALREFGSQFAKLLVDPARLNAPVGVAEFGRRERRRSTLVEPTKATHRRMCSTINTRLDGTQEQSENI